jgi:hypothetical protein
LLSHLGYFTNFALVVRLHGPRMARPKAPSAAPSAGPPSPVCRVNQSAPIVVPENSFHLRINEFDPSLKKGKILLATRLRTPLNVRS